MNLSHNRLSDLNNSTLLGLTSLETLDLSHNSLTGLADSALQNLPHLTELNLAGNRISVISARAFSGVNFLQSLNLADNEVTETELRSLSLLPGLESLDLSENRISQLRPGIFSALQHLRRLELRGNTLLTDGLSGESLVGLRGLTYLDLSDLNLTSLPSRLLLPTSNLTTLRLDRTELAELQAELFLSLSELRQLSVSGNRRLVRLAPSLFLPTPQLVRLDLSQNPRLSSLPPRLLTGLTALTELDVRDCRLTSLSLPPVNSWSLLEVGGNPWHCDCRLLSLYRAGLDLSCHRPPGLSLSRANLTRCEEGGGEEEEQNRLNLAVTLVVLGVVILTLLALVGWRFQARLHSCLLSRFNHSKWEHQDSLQAFQDTEEFIFNSSLPHHHHHLPTRPVPVTEL